MFSHVMVGTNDLDRARKFYDAVLGTLGIPAGVVDRHRAFWRTPTGVFSVWFMNGTTRLGVGQFQPFTATDPVWKVVGSANVW